MAFKDGPYLTAAILCQHIDMRPDGSVSLLNLIDQFIVETEGGILPRDFQGDERICVFMSFAAGKASGMKRVTLLFEEPRKTANVVFEQDYPCVPGGRFSQPCQLEVTIYSLGLHWFRVLLDGVTVARLPLWIVPDQEESAPLLHA